MSDAVEPQLRSAAEAILIVLVVGQEAVGLEGQKGGGHHDELRRSPQVPVGTHVSDEVVGHLRQRQLGDIEPLTGDKAQEQVEGALELG